MSKSVKRVRAALAAAGLPDSLQEMTGSTKSAADAAGALGIDVARIAKSVILQGSQSKRLVLFITAGHHRVDAERAALLVGEPVERADAQTIRRITGFAIGGVAPVGHLTPVQAFLDPALQGFATVWAAGGTPRHLFEISPRDLLALSGATPAGFTEHPESAASTPPEPPRPSPTIG